MPKQVKPELKIECYKRDGTAYGVSTFCESSETLRNKIKNLYTPNDK